jgi:hypothetical protein
MGSTLPPPADRWYPMLLIDQFGVTAHAWFPPGTATDPIHVLPDRVYGELCRLSGVEPLSPWVAFRDRGDALAAMAAACLATGIRPAAAPG